MISVLMPVYNIEMKTTKFKTAVNSVLNQSYDNFELLIINDGSKDNTGKIIFELQNVDKRIRIITKKNGGVESARREGLRFAKGDYILHMDQDDMYRKDAFEIFVDKIEKTKADVVIANSIRFIINNHFTFGKYVAPSILDEKVINHVEFMKEYYVSFFGINDLPVNIWNKLYRKDFLDRCPTPPLTGLIIEDLSYNMHILPYANKIAVIPDVLYYYRWGGYTNRYDKAILDEALVGYQLKSKQIIKYGLNDFKVSTSIELLNYLNGYFLQALTYNIMCKDDFLKEAERVLLLPEVQESVEIVKDYNLYHYDYIDAMLEHNLKRLYHIEVKAKKKRYVRSFLKSLLLKLN